MSRTFMFLLHLGHGSSLACLKIRFAAWRFIFVSYLAADPKARAIATAWMAIALTVELEFNELRVPMIWRLVVAVRRLVNYNSMTLVCCRFTGGKDQFRLGGRIRKLDGYHK